MNMELTETITTEERKLIEQASASVTKSNWTIGKCASKWCEKFADGRTDADFAELIGSSRQTVNFARRVYTRFCSRGSKLQCTWRQWKALLSENDEQIDESISVLLSDDGVPHDFEHLMMLHRARTGQPEPTAAAGLTGADIPPQEIPIATPSAEGEEETASAGATKPERQSTGKPGPEPAEEEAELPERGNGSPASSDGGRPKTSTSTLSGDSITEPPVVAIGKVGVDLQLLERGLEELPEQDLTEKQKAKVADLLRRTANVLDPPKKKWDAESLDYPEGMDTPEVRAAMQAWIDYRRREKKAIKSQKSANTILKAWADKGPERFIAAVAYSESQQFQGLYEEKGSRQGNSDLPRVRGTDWSEYDD